MTITANLCDNAGFFGDDRPLGSAAIVSYSPFVQACKAFPEARSMSHLCLFEAKRPIFLAKRPTLLAKHSCGVERGYGRRIWRHTALHFADTAAHSAPLHSRKPRCSPQREDH